jgi:DNA polymerase III epsilon subunit-like protein
MSKYIFYDFETTSLDIFNLEIIDIAAAETDFEYDLQNFFQIFLRPTIQEDGKVGGEEVHGYTKDFIENKKDLYEQKEGFVKFVNWINEMNTEIILVGYNNLGYDAMIIEHLMKKYELKFNHQIYHLDLYVLIKKINNKFNLKRNKKIPDMKLTTIYKILINKDIEKAHSAEGDILALIDLMKNIKNLNDKFNIDISLLYNEWINQQYKCVCNYLKNFILTDISYKLRFNKYLKSYNIWMIEDVYNFCNEHDYTYNDFILCFLLPNIFFDNNDEQRFFMEKISTFLHFYFQYN